MWEAAAETTARAPSEAVWALWESPARWGDWNDQIAAAELLEPLAAGARARIRFRRSPRALTFTVTELEPGRRFVDETRLPGAVMGHDHRVEPGEGGSVVRNRLYIDGPGERLWAALMGRGMRSSVNRFVRRERELAATAASASRSG